MHVLIDMDGVLADFETGFLDRWRQLQPDKLYIPVEQRTMSRITQDYPAEYRELIHEIFYSKGFIKSLKAIEGAVKALGEMQESGIEVTICSRPFAVYEYCVPEKYEWIEHNLGKAWTEKLILTRDKTRIRGDILIDDMPEIEGEYKPEWEHVVFDQPWNQEAKFKRRLKWSNWREVLLPHP